MNRPRSNKSHAGEHTTAGPPVRFPDSLRFDLAASFVQIVLGVTKVARLALSLSPAVVHGMLAGIGLSIALGQLVIVLGGHAHATSLDNLAELPAELRGTHFGSVVVGAVAVAV